MSCNTNAMAVCDYFYRDYFCEYFVRTLDYRGLMGDPFFFFFFWGMRSFAADLP